MMDFFFSHSHFNSQPHEEADTPPKFPLKKGNYFNSQPHEEADFLRPLWFCSYLYISTHSLTKRLTVIVLFFLSLIIFQLTASRRGWLEEWNSIKHVAIFQLTASRRGWRYRLRVSPVHLHFNSQPHEEADINQSRNIQTGRLNFNSQPHEEADTHPGFTLLPDVHFNSQPHEEADSLIDNK